MLTWSVLQEFAHQHQLLRDASNGSCVSNRNSSENLQNLQNQGIRKGPYPFWSTDGEIEMDDIIDDGLPPDERAGMQRTLHVMLTVEVLALLVLTCVTSTCFSSTCFASS